MDKLISREQRKSPNAYAGPSEGELSQDFRVISNEISNLAKPFGIRIIPYLDETLKLFSAQSAEAKKTIINSLNITRDLCNAAVKEQVDLANSRKLTWFALKAFGLIPSSDLLGLISDDDIVEIHNTERQLFRSFSYFNYCSYSLEELCCVPWTQLYVRNTFLEEQLKTAIGETLATQKTVAPNVSQHLVEESASVFKYKINYSIKMMSPLKSMEGAKDCFLVAVRAELLNARTTQEEELLLKQYYVEKKIQF